MALSLLLACALGASGGPVFVENDYPRALAAARERHAPLFIDLWAPWCHSCASLNAYVLPDPALRSLHDAFVWLKIDTENAANAPFLARFPVDVWPTLLVLDAATEQPLGRWLGTATATELAARLEQLLRARPGSAASPPFGKPALDRAVAAEARHSWQEAVAGYRTALLEARAGTLVRAESAERLAALLERQKDWAGCAGVAEREAGLMAPGTPRAGLALTRLACLERLPPGDDVAARRFAAFEEVRTLAESSQLLADDRSSLHAAWVEALRALKAPEQARAAAENWASFLDQTAAAAGSPGARAVFDAHRVLANIAAGTPQRALAPLEQSEKDFPNDYNPPARLAQVYLELGRGEEALQAARRAEARVYGPRTVRVLLLKAEALRRLGRRDEALATLAGADAKVAALPAAQRPSWAAGQIAAKRAELAGAR